ncbi:MAG: dihydroorotate dehydrogenase-like protein [Anaerolineales bacterium]|nr:dihydroorotate dehydrogenase-like protein [Anaerolineales bacterium]
MIDLTTTYLGLQLKNPIVPSSSPLTQKVDHIKQLEDAGAAAVVLHSLFEEQIMKESNLLDHYLNYGTESYWEALSFFPEQKSYTIGADAYVEHIRKVKAAVKIPVIASLNGVSTGGWLKYAQKIEQAGADALELNMYYLAADPNQTGVDVEAMCLELVRVLRASISIPIAVKLGAEFTAFANFVKQLDAVGIDGIVLFNRFYQPDFDLEKLEVEPSLDLSQAYELRARLRWAALLYGRVKTDLAITGGVHTAEDVLKCMMAGARVAMMASALLERGPDYVRAVLGDLTAWMEKHEYESIKQMQGSMSQKSVAYPAAFERANYVKVLQSFRPAI